MRSILLGLLLATASCGGKLDGDGAPGAAGASAHGPLNDRCADAQLLDTTLGRQTVSGDTSAGSDEHPGLDCDSKHVAGVGLNAAQLYYRLDVESGAVYRVSLRPSFYGFVYLFDASLGCSFESVQEACSSRGDRGDVSPIVNPNTTGTFEFRLGFSGPAVMAVDSDTSAGPFELEVERL